MEEKTTYERGTEYEDFVAEIYQLILAAERSEGIFKNIELERQKPLLCKSGTTTKVDIYWEYKIAEIIVRTAVDCKNYAGAVPVSELRDFAHKLADISGSPVHGLCVAKRGFQRGAKRIADDAGIKLINLREVEERDWEGYMKGVDLTLHALFPARIINVEPIVDMEWIKKAGHARGDKILGITAKNNEIFLNDKQEGFVISLHDLTLKELTKPGINVWEKNFFNGFLEVPNGEYKINSIKITYRGPASAITQTHIDFTKHIAAILEYVGQTAETFMITKAGKKLGDVPPGEAESP